MIHITGAGRRFRAHAALFPNPTLHFRKLLGDCGYRIFPVHQNRKVKGGRNHMLVFHKNEPTAPLLIYERFDGKRVVRPWSGPDRYDRLLVRLRRKSGTDFQLMLGANLKYKGRLGHPWADWLTEASRHQLRQSGVDI